MIMRITCFARRIYRKIIVLFSCTGLLFIINNQQAKASIDVTFRVNMNIQMLEGKFHPESGDVVTLPGSFNGWSTTSDTLFDGDGDSVYTRIVHFDAAHIGTIYDYKFFKTQPRGGVTWEEGENRNFTLPSSSMLLPLIYFNNESQYIRSSYLVTFRVNMRVLMEEKAFRPDLGDSVYVSGTFDPGVEYAMSGSAGDSSYAVSIPVSSSFLDKLIFYSFRKYPPRYHIAAETASVRFLVIAPQDTILPCVYFDDDSVHHVFIPGPDAATLEADSIAETSVVLRADVNPNGDSTECWFEYGKTLSYGNTSDVIGIPEGADFTPVGIQITGLVPGRHHYRVVAHNVKGSVTGEDKPFVTLGGPNNIYITFRVNMRVQILEGKFMPALGDRVSLRGAFNSWANEANIATDEDADSIYACTVEFPSTMFGISEEYKFFKSQARGGVDWEMFNEGNRSVVIPDYDSTLPAVYFNNEEHYLKSTYSVAFALDMRNLARSNAFRSDLGDSVMVSFGAGSLFESSVRLHDLDGDSIYTVQYPFPSSFLGLQIYYWYGKRPPRYGIADESIPKRSFILPESDSLVLRSFFNNDSVYHPIYPSPDAITLNANGIEDSSAVLNGSVNPNGFSTTWWFEYGPTRVYGNVSTVHSLSAGNVPVAVTCSLTSIQPGLYHFRICASNANGVLRGDDVTFLTTGLTDTVHVTFRVNMGMLLREGLFQPGSGDLVGVSGSFNGWSNTSCHPELSAEDSVYIVVIPIDTSNLDHTIPFKFRKIPETPALGWEPGNNREFVLTYTDRVLPIMVFGNTAPEVIGARGDGSAITLLWHQAAAGAQYDVQVATDPVYAGMVLADSGLTDTSKILTALPSGSEYYWRIRASVFGAKTDWSSSGVIQTGSAVFCTAVELQSGWNLVSLPLHSDANAVAAVFPQAVSGAFRFDDGYKDSPILAFGTGYWLRYPRAAGITMSGTATTGDVIALHPGWNLIGSFNEGRSVSTLTTIPTGIIASSLFAYRGGYQVANAIEPGIAYWVKSNAAGVLLAGDSVVLGNSIIRRESYSEATTLTVSDAEGRNETIQFLPQVKGEIIISHELPPPPPPGAFDVRLRAIDLSSSARMTSSLEISGAAFPIVINWHVPATIANHLILSIAGTHTRMNADGMIKIPSPAQVTLSSEFIHDAGPRAFSLENCYPNPFNPTTTINYQLPVESKVTLTVYNLLGQVVTTLTLGQQQAGDQSIQWNAGNYSSGIYFYRLDATSIADPGIRFSQTRKMLLVK
jgi:hypothetical protein